MASNEKPGKASPPLTDRIEPSHADLHHWTDVVQQVSTTQRALGFYENRGFIKSYRGPRNRRYYDKNQIARVRFILDMQGFGFSLVQIGNMLASNPQDQIPKLSKIEIANQLNQLEKQRDALIANIAQLKLYAEE